MSEQTFLLAAATVSAVHAHMVKRDLAKVSSDIANREKGITRFGS